MELNLVHLIENNLVLLIIVAVFIIVSRRKGTKKTILGPLEVKNTTDADKYEVIDPKNRCPYTDSYTAGMNAVRDGDVKLHNEIVLAREDIGASINAIDTGVINLNVKMDKLGDKQEHMDTSLLKILFRSNGQPPVERLLAGLKYVYKKENGDMRKAVIDMALKWIDIYETICTVKSEYRIPEVEVKRKEAKENLP